MKKILNRLKVGLGNKWWLFNYKLRELKLQAQFYWLLYRGSQPLDVNQKSMIVFSPHQDDETFGCGGVIALKREQGIQVKVVFVTDGGGSHHGHPRITRSEIVEIRRQEALSSLKNLGVELEDIHFLDKRDGALHRMTEAEKQQTIEEMAELLSNFQPQEVYVTHKQDRSKDHEITYELVNAAIAKSGVTVDLWQYAIWLLWDCLLFSNLRFEDLVGAYRVSIHTVQSKKKQSIETYRSQYLPIDAQTSALLPHGFLWRFCLPYEVFFKAEYLSKEEGRRKKEAVQSNVDYKSNAIFDN
jgi:N-acetylglucosamine malate deacetylase 1